VLSVIKCNAINTITLENGESKKLKTITLDIIMRHNISDITVVAVTANFIKIIY
jgi:hypothetical protein